MERYPKIEEYRTFGKAQATETLERLIKDKQLVQWIENEVGYDPTPKKYTQNANWETTKLQSPDASTKNAIRNIRGWHGTLPNTKHEIYILDRILERTQGYAGNVERNDRFEKTDTTRMRSWMCRDYTSTEYWKDQAKAEFKNHVARQEDVDYGSRGCLNVLTALIERELKSQELDEETVQAWDFFNEKTFDKVITPPTITDRINWEEIADYFLLSAFISVGNSTIYYKTKYFQ